MTEAEHRWLGEPILLAVHARQIAEHGGASGVRDLGLLASAVHRPLHAWLYEDPRPDLADLAAAYAYGIIRNHPFVDGNKRVAYVACRLFLLLNGKDFEASKAEKYGWFEGLASVIVSESDLAARIRSRIVERADGTVA